MVLHKHPSHLLHLVRFRMVSLGLEIENLLNAVFRKDMMIPSYPFVEAQTSPQMTQLVKRNIRIGAAPDYSSEQFIVPGHTILYNICGLVPNIGEWHPELEGFEEDVLDTIRREGLGSFDAARLLERALTVQVHRCEGAVNQVNFKIRL